MALLRRTFSWLVAEDDENDFLLVKRCCGRLDPSPDLIWARDGQEAQQQLSKQHRQGLPPPSLILSDLKMPRQNGLELLRWTKQQHELANIPFLLLTSSDQPEDRRQAEWLGVDDYLVKPASLRELSQVLRAALDHWCLQRMRVVEEHASLREAIRENKRLSKQARLASTGLRELMSSRNNRTVAFPLRLFLIVESDADRFKRLEESLWRADRNSRVRWARDAEEALAMLQEIDSTQPGVCVVSAFRGATWDGLELLRELRSRKILNQAKFAFIARSTESGDQERAYALGADTFLVANETDLNPVANSLLELIQSEG
jgi:CheY-like chemotaxis protein